MTLDPTTKENSSPYVTPSHKKELVSFSFGNSTNLMSVFFHDGNWEIQLSAAKVSALQNTIINNTNIKKEKFIFPITNKLKTMTGKGERYISKFCKIQVDTDPVSSLSKSANNKILLVMSFYEINSNNPNEFIYIKEDSFGIIIPYSKFKDCISLIHHENKASEEVEIDDTDFTI